MEFLSSQISHTRQKLAEAKYFLDQMDKNQANGPIFRYNLSACLAAARSVTMVMQKEFKKVPGFAKWYEDKQREMKADETMRYLNKRREVTIHQQPLPFRNVVRLDVCLAPIGSNKHSYGTYKWYFNDLPEPEKDIYGMCKEYIEKLEQLVEGWQGHFARLHPKKIVKNQERKPQ